MNTITINNITFTQYLETAYYVSECGQLASTTYKTPRLLGQNISNNGYRTLYFFDKSIGKIKRESVHRIVAHVFLGPSNLMVDHISGCKLDNRALNLRYITPSENQKNRYALLPKKKQARLSKEQKKEVLELAKIGISQHKIARLLGKHQAHISQIISKAKPDNNVIEIQEAA